MVQTIKAALGANAILGVSLAASRAAAASVQLPLWRYLGGVHAHQLPVPMMNILNGGAYADNALDIQEFMIMPVGAETFQDGLRMGTEIFHQLKKLTLRSRLVDNVGDEGGFAPAMGSTEDALSYVAKAVEAKGYKLGDDIVIAMDAAATEFYKDDQYHLAGEKPFFVIKRNAGNVGKIVPIISYSFY